MKRNQAGQTVEDFIDSNAMFLMYNPNDPNTFIHYCGSSTNPDLAMVSTNIADQYAKTVIGDPGSGHRMTKLTFEMKTKVKNCVPRVMWNFKKAKWNDFTTLAQTLVQEIPNDLTPYQEAKAFSDALKTSAKKNIPRGRIFQ
ncbi:hypothetical protein JTE90_013005 [Oedothorax gibbosus]|uniref:Uncharacterized protein n=1 Tax=Oedothorax gibbosus TaxID=931172 RepID=A0AAV6ULZ4_9ARAC|nr:hypothetical protein JTE90_013005 [Oedothorax gibbosus]